MKPSKKSKKKQLLRNNEYYGLQSVFDDLYYKSCKDYKFSNLIQLISSEQNILLAYRNIKTNKGSLTCGTDKLNISHYKDWEETEFIKYFQNKLADYRPKSVRRVEIPKEYQPGKTRPLGIPCMDDRIIQQCIKQVLEPICEAKFHNHSYGFRPNRSAHHALFRAMFLMNNSNLHYVVDIDIKSFFDNVNHAKLMKQMWALGIQDKKLLCIIGKILKSYVQGIGKPTKGTPQGGIISPLLSNIVLNELDWWLSNQWETKVTKHQYSDGNLHRALKTSNLKEFFFVRYCDDFKIICRDYKTAQKIFEATKQWLWERLGLEISPEKSKITNVRKGRTEFLGFALKVSLQGEKRRKRRIRANKTAKNKKKRKQWAEKKYPRYVVYSSLTEKAKLKVINKIKEKVVEVQKRSNANQVSKLNSAILGLHNYYRYATHVNLDFGVIDYIVSKTVYNRLPLKKKQRHKKKGKKKREPPVYSETYKKFYGEYNGKPKIVAGIPIFPIYGIKHTSPLGFTQETCNYTEQGRRIIHDKLNNVEYLIRHLLSAEDYGRTIQYMDNRISLIAGQNGKCFVTGEPLELHDMHCHHKKPKHLGGTDEYKNLVWAKSSVHKLIHSTLPESIAKYTKLLNLNKNALKKLNSLRLQAENKGIDITI